MENEIIITMLGEFSLTYQNKKITDEDNRSKKIWRLLEYLITFRDKEITQNELIELLWPEEQIKNPVNALKTTMHRVRSLLKQLELPEEYFPIVHAQGSYRWNKSLKCSIDNMIFDQLYCKSNEEQLSEDERLNACLQALEYYKGYFLPKASHDSWAMPITTYYHSIYLKLVNQTIGLLEKRKRYDMIIDICQKAMKFDAYEEFLHYYLILSYYKTGQQQLAISQYDYITDLLYSKFGVKPSDNITSLYKEIIKSDHNLENDLNLIRNSLTETDTTDRAYYCHFSIFKEIYHLEARSAVRSGNSIYLSLITIYSSGGNVPPKKTLLNTSMVRLKDSIQHSLRRGDVFARYSTAQYILMLPTTSYENGEMVMERILKRFRQEKPRISVNIAYKLLPLEPSFS